MSIIVKQAGAAIPRVEKRAAESIVYTLDCREILDKHELIVTAFASTSEVRTPLIRTRKGIMVEVRIENDPITTAQYLDYTVQIELSTSFNNTKLAVFQLRVHK